ncbi:MAG: hypothetical protein WCY19_00845 [Candidatus Gastranaerophilaceae bacterium]
MKKIKKNAQSLIEYGLILALVAVIAVVVLGKFGKTITGVGNNTSNSVNQVSGNAMINYCTSINCTGFSNGTCTGCP